MARPRSYNPFAFTPLPVTLWTSAIFIALFAALLTTHNIVPSAPSNPTPVPGINLTEAWLDLQHLTNGFHPYNSKRNDEVRNWLLSRIEAIGYYNSPFTGENEFTSDNSTSITTNGQFYIFNDLTSNLTFASSDSSLSVAHSGLNIMVYIRGYDDPPGPWWREDYQANPEDDGKYGVMVNAHYDSVPSGYGATDDGAGVISILQLISYFTCLDNTPKRGIVALLNNGEEDYLNGAYAFTQHPMSKFPHSFVNLEGAGAGGRAWLFRSTDEEVTKFYKKSPYPTGLVISADGFKRRLIRSDTDYSVFAPLLGMRGIDIAFMEPRARYHTNQDSARYTSIDSVWHMLSAALATVKGLSNDESSTFEGQTTAEGGVNAGSGSDSVWFDIFGRTFAIFQLHSLFAISVTLLVVTPLMLIALHIILARLDRWYLFSRKKPLEEEEESVQINGLRGFVRFPVVIVVSTAAAIGLAFLLTKVNPYICYSSEYAVWAMMLSAWFAITWFFLRGADAMRPTAFTRTYGIFWMYIFAYILLVVDTVAENNLSLAGGYFLVIYFAAIFCALFISYLEFFSLPKKTIYAEHMAGIRTETDVSRPATAEDPQPEEGDEAHERTSLLRGDRQTTFAGYGTRRRSADESTAVQEEDQPEIGLPKAYPREQRWSGKLPSWTWFLQLLFLAPMPVILVGEVALLATSSLHQTPADGSPVLTIYLFFAILTLLLLLPITPFIHRFGYPIPLILFLVFCGTLIYNVIAFPFTEDARLKVYFVQRVDLDSGINEVSLTGLMPYVRDIASSIPSAAGQELDCGNPDYAARSGLTKCGWSGIPPNVVSEMDLDEAEVQKDKGKVPLPPEKTYKEWVTYDVKKLNSTTEGVHEAVITLSGKNTRACRLLFERDIADFNVTGFTSDPRFPRVGSMGCKQIRLWNREWSDSWEVNVKWESSEEQGDGLDGEVVCLWSDVNLVGTIPAWDEVMRFMPKWSVATKLSDGLVEGSKKFKV